MRRQHKNGPGTFLSGPFGFFLSTWDAIRNVYMCLTLYITLFQYYIPTLDIVVHGTYRHGNNDLSNDTMEVFRKAFMHLCLILLV